MTPRTDVFVITGAAGVIGSAIVERFVRRGASLLLTDVDESRLEQSAAAALESTGAPSSAVRTVAVDLTSGGAANAVVASAVSHFGRLTGCVNAAGVERPIVASSELTAAALEQTFRINVYTLVEMCAATVAQLRSSGSEGRIVNLASGAALSGAAFMTAYNSSKHAVLGVTRSFAKEVAMHSIAVNAICPGFVESTMVDEILSEIACITGVTTDPRTSIPSGRLARPDEVASVAEFLAFDAPIYMTGSALVVDGGLYA